MTKIDKLKYFIYCLELFFFESFLCFCSILGIHIGKGESSPIYLLFNIVLFLVTSFFLFFDLKKSIRHIKKKLFLLLPVVMTIIFLFEYAITSGSGLEWTYKAYRSFVLYCIPAIYIGIDLTVVGKLKNIYPYLDLLAVIMSVGLLRGVANSLESGIVSLLGEGGDYNNIAYTSAVCFAFVYYGFLSNRKDRFSIFQSKLFRIISPFLMIGLAVSALASGGRGGSLLLIIYFITLSLKFISKKNIFRTIIISIPVFLILIISAFKYIESNPALSSVYEYGVGRAFEYISDGGIDTSKSSNRDEIYVQTWKTIEDNPIIGNGLFRTIGVIGYPHNFILEVLLDGGFLFLFFWLAVLYRTAMKLRKIVRCDKDMYFLVIIVLYLMVDLMFSGSYLMSGLFWFVLASIYHYNFVNYEKNFNIAK